MNQTAAADEETVQTLLRIARQHGTPAYAYDLLRVRSQVDKLRTQLPEHVEILYSIKANGSLGISSVIAKCGIGADVASAGELVTAIEAGYPPARIFVAGPYKSPETVALLRSLPEALVSIDSRSELSSLARAALPNRAVLRLRPDFESAAAVAAGPDARFGIPPEELADCRAIVASGAIDVIGFHVFAGSQVLRSAGVVGHLRATIDQALRSAEVLGIDLKYLNLGGGFGVPYAAGEKELDLAPISEELDALFERAGRPRFAFELGRYLVAQAGWYLTSVVGHQTYQGRPAVVVDGGTHQRADLCGLGLRCKADPPLVLDAPGSPLTATDVLGCLSLPADVLAEASPLPALEPGNILAFGNAGAYGLCSSPTLFHGHPLPAEVAFDGSEIVVMRCAQTARRLLEGQTTVGATIDSSLTTAEG
jgi:diaminopimelate decarboxylase